MAEFPALPLWTDAYLGDTTHLKTVEHGAYLLLLMTAWRSRDCRLPDDDALLARYARCGPREWKRLRPIIEPFFDIENGFWTQRRLTDEAASVRQKKDAAAANGRASALKRAGRHTGETQSIPAADTEAAQHAKQQYDADERANSLNNNEVMETERSASLNGASNGTPTNGQLNQNQNHVPLDKSNGGDPDKILWDSAKAFLKPERADPGSLIGKWCRDFGKEATAQALTKAQLERPAQRIPFVEACLRKAKQEHGSGWDFMP